MRKGLIAIVIVMILTIPIVNAWNLPQRSREKIDESTILQCFIDGKRTEREMPISTIQELINMGTSHKEDFLIIYDKTKSDEEVAVAFENIKPFFKALRDSHLTEKTVDELNDLYYGIRDKISEPRHKPVCKTKNSIDTQPMGIWNGIPTPIWANALCGIFDAGICAGFACGTHALIPTIGIDAFITYGFQGTSLTVGLSGATAGFSAFQVIIGFVGILIVLPLIMLGPYFMTGLCGVMFGIGA